MNDAVEELITEFGLERNVTGNTVRGYFHGLIIVYQYQLTNSLIDVYDFNLRRFRSSSDIDVCRERIKNCIQQMKEYDIEYKMDRIKEDF